MKDKILMIFLTFVFTTNIFSFANSDYFTDYFGNNIYYTKSINSDKSFTLQCTQYSTINVTNSNQYECLKELEDLYKTSIVIPKLTEDERFDELELLTYDVNITKEQEHGFNNSLAKINTFFNKYEAYLMSIILILALIDFILTLMKAKMIIDNPNMKRDFYSGVANLGALALFLSLYGTLKIFIANWSYRLLNQSNSTLEGTLTIVKQELTLTAIGLTGIGALTSVLFFMLAFIRLGISSGNPQLREKALKGLLINGITTTILGSVFFWFLFALNVF